MSEYKPQPQTAEILNWCLEKIDEVPYKVTLRWIFYRAVQEKGLTKGAYGRFKKWTSNARKRFWNGWTPYTLADDTRELIIRGGGYETPKEWFESFKDKTCLLDKRPSQPCVVIVCFEAQAMVSQFRHYTSKHHVSLVPFKGDTSIPQKWELAKKIEYYAEEYGKPMKILYFGDLDPKGLEIPHNAMRDVRAWCKVDFDFERVGLNYEHVEKWNIPDNPEKPNQYQWEALSDEGAKELIETALAEVVDLQAIKKVEELETETTKKWKKMLENLSEEDLE